MTATVQYITDISSTSGQTTYTFTGVSLGTPGADRKIVLCVETRKTGTGLCEIVSASIGGVAATPIFQQASAPSGTVNYAGIISADVPSGSTGDISITFSVPVLRVGGQVYAVTGSPHQADASLLDHPSVSLDVPSDGFAIGCLSVASSQSFDWGGLDQDHIGLIGGSLRVASASRSYETASDGQALSITRTSGTWSSPVGVFATWGPEGDEEPGPAEGSGASSAVVSSSGEGHRDASGLGEASLTVTVAGEGSSGSGGSGSAVCVVGVAGAGHTERSGSGSDSLSVAASGSGYRQSSGSGELDAVVSTAGEGYAATGSYGETLLLASASGQGYVIRSGEGAAALAIGTEGAGQSVEPSTTGVFGLKTSSGYFFIQTGNQ